MLYGELGQQPVFFPGNIKQQLGFMDVSIAIYEPSQILGKIFSHWQWYRTVAGNDAELRIVVAYHEKYLDF